MKSLKYAVVGCGAIGGYYGGKLAHANKDVHFLLHRDYEHVHTNGLHVDSVDGNFWLPSVAAYSQSSNMPICDIVLVCLKTTQNHLLPELLKPIVGPQTCIILIQNGLDMEADLAIHFPQTAIVGAMAFICSNKVGPGHIHHLDYGAITLGNYQHTSQDLLNLISDDFQSAGIPVYLVENLLTARWRKLVWNIPYNGLTVVAHAQTDKLMSEPSTRQLLTDLMHEVIDAAQACGALIPHDFADEMISSTDRMRPYSPSMMLDFLNYRSMEIDYMYSHPIQKAAQHGFNMAKTRVVEQMLRFIEHQQSL